jgi:hypothetical protein
MDAFQQPFSGPSQQPESVPITDPRLQPTPDYAMLGPGSDVSPTSGLRPAWQSVNARRFAPVFAVAMGVLLAILTANAGTARAAWSSFANLFSPPAAPTAAVRDSSQLDRMKPQKQAEALLELAVTHNDGAVDQISSRVGRWQGKVKWDTQIATLTTAALNSSDMRVRESGIEVELAAYGLAKNSSSLNYLLQTADSRDHAQRIWALWALGLMANRGVDADHVVRVLIGHLKDADDGSRRWAVEGLALSGSVQAIEPLLKTTHEDPAASVRERAACGLAESGMFTREQRLAAVPQLLNYSDDPSLDAQTQGWAFQALGDITRQRLPHDSNAWRSWYESAKGD